MIFTSARIRSGVVQYTTVSFVDKKENSEHYDLHERSTTWVFFPAFYSRAKAFRCLLAGKRGASAIGFERQHVFGWGIPLDLSFPGDVVMHNGEMDGLSVYMMGINN